MAAELPKSVASESIFKIAATAVTASVVPTIASFIPTAVQHSVSLAASKAASYIPTSASVPVPFTGKAIQVSLGSPTKESDSKITDTFAALVTAFAIYKSVQAMRGTPLSPPIQAQPAAPPVTISIHIDNSKGTASSGETPPSTAKVVESVADQPVSH